ncbi:MAG: glucosyl transferase [Acidimicrobiales bacterium]
MTTVAFFGHDMGDAAVRRRVQAFTDDGIAIQGYMMRRGEPTPTEWPNVDLGPTIDEDYRQRLGAIVRGVRVARAHAADLGAADLVYARNLDMLVCAAATMTATRISRPLIYECLDVHRLMVRTDPVGRAMRTAERLLLRRTDLLVVSSPGFIEHYFDVHHPGRFRSWLLENRMAPGAFRDPRPAPGPVPSDRPLRLGWFGVLRCRRSLHLLTDLAAALGDRVEVVISGRPNEIEMPDFHRRVDALDNVRFTGPFRSPEDLPRLYAGVDLMWAADFMDAGFNSEWLLPNRLYEGGWYVTPAVAPAGTVTGRWIAERQAGFTVAEPLERSLIDLIDRLDQDRAPIQQARIALAGLPDDAFIQPPGEMQALLDAAIGPSPATPRAESAAG